jgi:hypothetical protein
MPIVRDREPTLRRGDQSLCNGLKLGRPRMALPPDRFDFYPSFSLFIPHDFESGAVAPHLPVLFIFH